MRGAISVDGYGIKAINIYMLIGLNQQAEKTHKAQICHSERSVSGVEESSHLWEICSQIGAKILRLPLKIFDFPRSLRMTAGGLFNLTVMLNKADKH